MKKFMTSVIASVLVALSLAFTACATATDTTYKGNYQDIDAEQLYTSTRELPTNEEINELSLKSTVSIETTVTQDNQVTSALVNLSGVMQGSMEESSAKGSISMLVTESVTNSKGTTSSTIDMKFYVNEDNYYLNYTQSTTAAVGNTSTTVKCKISKADFLKYFEEYGISFGSPTQSTVPSEQTEFISYLNELCDNVGYKISADTTNGIKVKVDIANEDKFITHTKNTTPDLKYYELLVNEFEMYYVFDKNNNFVAQKSVNDITATTLKGDIDLVTASETRVYNGEITFPSDLDSYTPIS